MEMLPASPSYSLPPTTNTTTTQILVGRTLPASFPRSVPVCVSQVHAKPSTRSGASLPALTSSLLLGVLRAKEVLAVSYDDVLDTVTATERALTLPSVDVDVGGAVNSVVEFVNMNPLALIAGIAAVSVPLVVSQLLGGSKNWGFISAKDAFQKLGDKQAESELLDIRDVAYIKAEGSPDLRVYNKRVVQVGYSGEGSTFFQKVLGKFKNPADTTLYILDRFDGNSIEAAKLMATNGFKAAYAVKDGAEGPSGWQKSQLPWLLPRKGLTFDIGAFKDVIDNALNENPNLVPASLGVAAAAGVGLVVFSEAETALQLVGSAALIQLFLKKFLFAKDRNKTLKELQTFLDSKVAPKEFVDELKGIGKGLLPRFEEVTTESSSNGALTAQTTGVSEPGVQDINAVTSDKPLQAIAEDKDAEKVAAEFPPAAVTHSDPPRSNRPLSPYSQYSDLKPPTSPTPSTP